MLAPEYIVVLNTSNSGAGCRTIDPPSCKDNLINLFLLKLSELGG